MWPNPQKTADLVTLTEENHNGKLHFLRNVCQSKTREREQVKQGFHFAVIGVSWSSVWSTVNYYEYKSCSFTKYLVRKLYLENVTLLNFVLELVLKTLFWDV